MIKNTKRRTVIKGDVPTLMTDLTTIVRRLDDTFQNGAGMTKEVSKEVIMHSFELAFKSNAEVLGDTLKMIFDMASGSDKDGEKYRVWCETNEIRDKVLVALENRGVKWASGDTFENFKDVFDAPMGLIVDDGLWQVTGTEKDSFDGLKFEELKAEDLIKEVEGNE
jgi:hypothetical protein